MAIDDLDPVALEAFLIAHALMKKLERNGAITKAETTEILAACRFAVRIAGLDQDPRVKSAETVLDQLIGRAGSN